MQMEPTGWITNEQKDKALVGSLILIHYIYTLTFHFLIILHCNLVSLLVAIFPTRLKTEMISLMISSVVNLLSLILLYTSYQNSLK